MLHLITREFQRRWVLTNTSTVFEANGIESSEFYYRKNLTTPVKVASDTAFTYLSSGSSIIASPGAYDVKLRVVSKIGCANTVVRSIVIVPLKQVTTNKPYLETFESLDSGSWQMGPDTLASSWRVGKPGPG